MQLTVSGLSVHSAAYLTTVTRECSSVECAVCETGIVYTIPRAEVAYKWWRVERKLNESSRASAVDLTSCMCVALWVLRCAVSLTLLSLLFQAAHGASAALVTVVHSTQAQTAHNRLAQSNTHQHCHHDHISQAHLPSGCR